MSNIENSNEKRVVVVEGQEFVLPTLWGEEEVQSLMDDFRETRGDYVSITQDGGVVHVLMTDSTSVRFETRTIRPSRTTSPRRIR